MQRFENKVALVTGAGSGIGKATAIRLASEGASVFCVDINTESMAATLETIIAQGGVAQVHGCDVSDEAQVNACVDACIEQYGKLDTLAHLAGILRFDNVTDLDFAGFKKVIDVNLCGTFLLCKAVLPHLVETKGSIVNAGSTSALSGLPWGVAYSASKGGVLAMTRSIAIEYAKRGVRANIVCPGDIDTPMIHGLSFPDDADWDLLPRIQSLTGPRGPETVASVIAMLASEDGIHITGEHIRMDGGTLS